MTEVIHLGPRAPARLPTRMSIADEFQWLFQQREQINRQLNELTPILEEALGLNEDGWQHAAPCALPKSGLRLVAQTGGALLFKGGPAA